MVFELHRLAITTTIICETDVTGGKKEEGKESIFEGNALSASI